MEATTERRPDMRQREAMLDGIVEGILMGSDPNAPGCEDASSSRASIGGGTPGGGHVGGKVPSVQAAFGGADGIGVMEAVLLDEEYVGSGVL